MLNGHSKHRISSLYALGVYVLALCYLSSGTASSPPSIMFLIASIIFLIALTSYLLCFSLLPCSFSLLTGFLPHP